MPLDFRKPNVKFNFHKRNELLNSPSNFEGINISENIIKEDNYEEVLEKKLIEDNKSDEEQSNNAPK